MEKEFPVGLLRGIRGQRGQVKPKILHSIEKFYRKKNVHCITILLKKKARRKRHKNSEAIYHNCALSRGLRGQMFIDIEGCLQSTWHANIFFINIHHRRMCLSNVYGIKRRVK